MEFGKSITVIDLTAKERDCVVDRLGIRDNSAFWNRGSMDLESWTEFGVAGLLAAVLVFFVVPGMRMPYSLRIRSA